MPIAIPSSSVIKKKISRKKSSSHASLATVNTSATSAYANWTTAADNNARQVARNEFQDLALLVAQLKKESSRHIRIETDFQTEFEFFNAELASNRHAIGKLAETLSEETSSLRETLSTQLQQFQVESNQRFTDLQNSMERLEFRFKHHIRDCQTITDQVDSHQELMQNLRKQLAQTQLLMDHQKEEQKTFMETIQYTTTKAQEKSSAAFDECSKQLDSFQQQMVGYVKKVEQDSTASFELVNGRIKELETKERRHASLLHQTMDDFILLRQGLDELGTLRKQFHLLDGKIGDALQEKTNQITSIDTKINEVSALVEQSDIHREMMKQIERVERHLQVRLESMAELLALCVELMKSARLRGAQLPLLQP